MHPPPIDSWPALTQVNVRIDDDWEAPERGYFEQGIRKWNGTPPPNCSFVSFSGFVARNFTDYGQSPPDNTLDWMRFVPSNSRNGEVLYHYIDEVNFRIRAIRIRIMPDVPNIVENTFYVYLGTHETGHTFDLDDCISKSGCSTNGLSIMGGHSNSPSFNTGGPTVCDHQAVSIIYCGQPNPPPSATPSPTPPQTEDDCLSQGWSWNSFSSSCSPTGFVGPCPDNCTLEMFGDPAQGGNGCAGPTDFCVYPSSGCEIGYANSGGGCCCSNFNSPILIDVAGNGFSLTAAQDGVDFDINGDRVKEHLSWTSPGSDDAWLVLDHSANGTIDNGRELFGNYTPQLKPPAGVAANGFLALSEYDKSTNGGNADKVITSADSVFSRLRLWQDSNHNGIAEAVELHTLDSLGVNTLELDYKESRQRDQYGNQFRFRARVRNDHGQLMGKWAWDVFLVKTEF
jgi:hypothetical protein